MLFLKNVEDKALSFPLIKNTNKGFSGTKI